MAKRSLFICLWLIAVIVVVEAAPSRSKTKNNSGPQLFYDQKQKGDYNIQLHLKDFQIIALLGDSDGGDYEYSYDYADFTVKPSTSRPSTSTQLITSTTSLRPPPSSSSTSALPPSSTTKPPYSFSTLKPISTTIKPIVHQTGFNSNKPSVTPQNKPSTEDSNNSIENAIVSISDSNKPMTPEGLNLFSEHLQAASNSSTQEPIMTMTPGKIKVQIMGEPADVPSNNEPIGQLHIVPGEELGEIEGAQMDDVLKRCASGFSRDKKGRCRRVRRPGVPSQLPFGFSRFASNLASRLRLSPSQSSLDTSELS